MGIILLFVQKTSNSHVNHKFEIKKEITANKEDDFLR